MYSVLSLQEGLHFFSCSEILMLFVRTGLWLRSAASALCALSGKLTHHAFPVVENAEPTRIKNHKLPKNDKLRGLLSRDGLEKAVLSARE